MRQRSNERLIAIVQWADARGNERIRILAMRQLFAQCEKLLAMIVSRSKPRGYENREYMGSAYVAFEHAVYMFDCSRGFAFTTYVWRAVRQRVLAQVDDDYRGTKLGAGAKKRPRHCPADPAGFAAILDDADHEASEEMRELCERASNQASELHPRTNVILRLHAGGKTLVEIAALLGITRERVRQIEATAIEKLTMESDVSRMVS